jgi:hypothetical protein
MDLEMIGVVMLVLFLMPVIILLWCCAFAFVDDCFCDGEIQYRVKQWVRRKIEVADNGSK